MVLYQRYRISWFIFCKITTLGQCILFCLGLLCKYQDSTKILKYIPLRPLKLCKEGVAGVFAVRTIQEFEAALRQNAQVVPAVDNTRDTSSDAIAVLSRLE